MIYFHHQFLKHEQSCFHILAPSEIFPQVRFPGPFEPASHNTFKDSNKYKKMFNNFTSEQQYQCCDIILPRNEGRGSLLIGDFNSATDQLTIKQHQIRTIITAATGLEHLQIPSSVTHIVYPLQDAKSENIRSYFEECFLTIDRKLCEGGVLVHCAAGVSRSATLVIAYLMKKNRIGFRQALAMVKNKRPGVCPNLGFEMQLKAYEADLFQQPKVQPKLLSKNLTEKMVEDRRKSHEYKKPDNVSIFQFEPLSYAQKKRNELKKPVARHTGYSRPREKPLYQVMQTELFVSGKGANRPSSQAISKQASTGRKDPLMGTWGPQSHKSRQFQL